jgi:hypothetical protein
MRTTPLDPDGWPAPQRAPQHAASQFRHASPTTLHAHRALRLFAAAGVCAAGLCLVVGLFVLVASASTPGRAQRLATEAAQTAAGNTAGHSPAARVPHRKQKSGGLAVGTSADQRPKHTTRSHTGGRPASQQRQRHPIAAFSGHGDLTTAQFRLGTVADWQITWSYSCPAGLTDALLVVQVAAPGALSTTISEAGLAGHGVTWLRADGLSHWLIVTSTCSWTMEVTQRP